MKKFRIYLIIFTMIMVLVSMKNLYISKNESGILQQNKLEHSKNNLSFFVQNDNEEYESLANMPLKGMGYVFSKAECVNDIEYTFDSDTWSIIFPNNSANISCKLYFDKLKKQTPEDIIASKTVATRTDFSTVLTTDTTGAIYSAEDDDGTSYYYAGAVTDNWVRFAGFYWRIIRINGDGSIRIIYQGDAEESDGTDIAPVTTGEGTQIGTSAFNGSLNNNAYVGYMYTFNTVHGLGTSSTIKGVLETWYANNLTNYESYIDTNAGFCGDRTLASGSGTGTTVSNYGAYGRLISSKSPSLKCNDSTDLYTINSSNKGNKSISKPIGLITADELAYAGGIFGTGNSNYYLYSAKDFWSISPSAYSYYTTILAGTYAFVFIVNGAGTIVATGETTSSLGVRPVINLKAGTAFTSESVGTSDNPYVVVA